MTESFRPETVGYKRLIALLFKANLLLAAAPATALCVPPVPPLIPESDRAFVEYADLLGQDFEQYFAETTKYTMCLDQARADFMTEARSVSRMYEHFIKRADALGVTDKIAVDP